MTTWHSVLCSRTPVPAVVVGMGCYVFVAILPHETLKPVGALFSVCLQPQSPEQVPAIEQIVGKAVVPSTKTNSEA